MFFPMTRTKTCAVTCCFVAVLFVANSHVSEAADTVPGYHWQKAASPADFGWSVEKLAESRAFSKTLSTAALMIVQDGIVVDEWGPTALPLKCHSVRKSLLSALYGPYVNRNQINLDRTLKQLGINDNEPSLTDVERDARIRDLLKARSGIYHPALYETKAMAAARPMRGAYKPDTFWYYNNWDFNALCSIFENQTGRSIFEEFESRIAGPLGMQDFHRSRHTRYVTGDDSVHPAYPFQLSTRDLARFGLLFLRDGRWGNQQLISQGWIRESTTSYSDVGASGGYGYLWWIAVEERHFPGVSLPEGSYSARGYRGQYLVVIPAWDLVICHRVNSFQDGTAVSKADFGKLLSLIFAARLNKSTTDTSQPNSDSPATKSVDSPAIFDVIIRNGEVIDGTGRKRFRADVAIRNGRIVKIGALHNTTAHREIDATGKLVVPGFIDLHSHAEKGLVSDDPARRSAPNLITQGITTVVVNQDGGGPLDLADQRKTMRQLGIGLNVVQVLGHGTIRRAVMGADHQRPATEQEIKRMQKHLRTALSGGAFGMSAGLEYIPGRWSTPREMEELARTIAESDGVYIVHERSSGSRPMWFLPSRDSADQPSMIDNLHELIEIAANTNVRTVATHIKARGTDFWGSSTRMNELLRKARKEGVPIYADQYPYNTSGSDGRIVLIPSWATAVAASTDSDSTKQKDEPWNFSKRLESVLADKDKAAELRRDIEYEIKRRGGPDNILIVDHPNNDLIGQSLSYVAGRLKIAPVNAAISLQLKGDRTRRGGARLRAYSMSEKDVEAFAKTPWTATSSDAGITLPSDGLVHPRFYGAFPRKIRRYAIERGLISIEDAVRVSTSLPEKILKLKDRGVIREGAHADLVVFDPDSIRDTADAFNPHRYAEGIDYVFVNGKLAAEGQRWLGSLPGRVLVRHRKAP
jgi:N-acyl-D-amino-acid deacylase